MQKPRLADVPEEPGVYRFFNSQKRVIYVGKAINLRSRISSYFQENLATKTQQMVEEAERLDWTIVTNEIEALQLEFSWIKSENPKFNVRFKDDKSYPYIAVTVSEDFPRIFITRGLKRKGIKYLGPFPNARDLRHVVDHTLRTFPVRTCSNSTFNDARRSNRPCLLGHIQKCSAPCVKMISADDHRILVQDFVGFFSRDPSSYLKKIEKKMYEAAETENFELAAALRDDLQALEGVLEDSSVIQSDDVNADFVALVFGNIEMGASIFSVRQGKIRGQRSVVSDLNHGVDPSDSMKWLLTEIYGDLLQDIPSTIYVNVVPSTIDSLIGWLQEIRGSKVEIKVPKRGDKSDLLEIVRINAVEAVTRHQIERSSDLSKRAVALTELQQALSIPNPVLRIECFDISHIQGSHAVGSMVVFEDGAARKAEYRRFAIRGRGDSDVDSLKEVLSRRMKRLIDENEIDFKSLDGLVSKFAYKPDLIVIDGGLPQVNAAHSVLVQFGFGDIPIFGIAKRLEELWPPEAESPIILSRKSEALFLLQRVRDEAHRFAITYHRSKRARALVESVLDEIPGLGESRRKALLQQFPSLTALKKASAEEISQVPGIGTELAHRIHEWSQIEQTGLSIDMSTGEILE